MEDSKHDGRITLGQKGCYLNCHHFTKYWAGRDGVGGGSRWRGAALYHSPSRILLFFKIFPLLRSLCLAIQVEGYSPNGLVVKEVISKIWFHFRMNFLELCNDFDPPCAPHPEFSTGKEQDRSINYSADTGLSGRGSGEAEQPSGAQSRFDPCPQKSSLIRVWKERKGESFAGAGNADGGEKNQKLPPSSPKAPGCEWKSLPCTDTLSFPEREVCFQALATCVRRSPWERLRGRLESSATGWGAFLGEAGGPDTCRTQRAEDAEPALPSLVARIVVPRPPAWYALEPANASRVCAGSPGSSPARLPAPKVVLPPRSARAALGALRGLSGSPHAPPASSGARREWPGHARRGLGAPIRVPSPAPLPSRSRLFSLAVRRPPRFRLNPGSTRLLAHPSAQPHSPEKWNLPWNSRWLEPGDWACSEARAGFGLK